MERQLSRDKRNKLVKARLKIIQRIDTANEKWGDKRKLRQLNRKLA